MVAAVPVEFTLLLAALVFFILVAWALNAFTGPLKATVSPIPVIGGWLSSNISSLSATFLQATIGAANASFGALSGALDFLNWAWGGLVGGAARLAAAVSANAVRMVTVIIPQQINAAAGALRAEASGLYAIALQWYQQALAYAAQRVDGLYSIALQWYQQALAFTLQQVAALEVDIAAAEAHAVQLAQGLIAAEEAARVAAVNVALAEAQTLFAQSIAVGAAAEASLRNDLGAEAFQLGRVISTGLNDVKQQATAQNAATAATGASALALVATAVRAIEDSPCMQQCEPLGALGADLGSLDFLVVFALMAAIEANPRGAATAIEEFLAPVIGSVEAGAGGFGLKL